MVETLAQSTPSPFEHWGVIIGFIGIFVTVIGSTITLLMKMSRTDGANSIRFTNYDSILETVVAKQQLLDSRQHDHGTSIAVIQNRLDSIPACAARSEDDQPPFRPRR